MKTNYLVITLVLLSLLSCKNQTGETSSVESSNTETVTEGTSKGKYAIKSGIVVYKMQMMGMDVKQTLTFDDYGNKEATDINMEVMGTKVHTATITKDGFLYNLDMVKKTGTKSPVNLMNNSNIDFQNLTKEMEKEMNLKREGQEDFLGKTCEKMSIDYTKMKMKGNFLVYKGVALKMDTDLGSMKMKLEAEQFEENADVPSEKFDIPADFTIEGN